MSARTQPSNVTCGTYQPLDPTLNNGLKVITVTSNTHAVTVGADMALWDSTSNVFVRPDQCSGLTANQNT